MKITVTGANGQLGRLAIAALLERGVPAGDIVAAVRTPSTVSDLAAHGIEVREADYDRPETLASAFAGTDKLLFVSGTAVGQRAVQHANVIDAAKTAGVGLIVYTSISKADTTPLGLAAEHKVTEGLLRESGVPYVVLRNAFYVENWTGQAATAIENGAVIGAAGEGRVSAAPRSDFAAAAAAALTTDGHENKVYELGGDAFTLAEYAAELSRQGGKPVSYHDVPVDEYARVLEGAGLPAPVAAMIADGDAAIARGDLDVPSGDLERLLGCPATPLARSIADALG